jgi:acyl-coenzyme A synthetase/AMP-(fatty) acid ligase
VTGEIVNPHLIDMWFKKFPGIPVINAYGPTEASDDITHYLLTHTSPPMTSIPLGKPIRNTHIYIVDDVGNLCPIGVKGEIWVSGVGVGRGYLNDPEKTSLAFGQDPFRSEPGVRMYRTGDIGCWSAEGDILLFGRKDHQVKIRGHRIELGEIEAALASHGGVREAVVVAREDTPGEKRLVAYYTCRERKASELSTGEEMPGAEVLRAYLNGKLPEYMVPAAYVRLERLPLTANGKLDRKALPAPEGEAYVTRGYEAPKGEIETAVAGIWGEVLELERVGRHDNFFELGGHSLLVVRVITRLRQALSVEVKIGDLFARPVLSALAEHIINVQLAQFDTKDLGSVLKFMQNNSYV